MFCSHCGKEVAAGAKFCANCGAAVNSQPTPAAEPPKAPAPTAQREVPAVEQVGTPSGNMTESGGQPEKKKKGVLKKPLIIIAAVLVLIVGFGAVLSLFEGDSEPDSGSKGSNGLDWVEKIPYIPGEVPLIGTTALEDELSYMNKTSYEKLKELGNRGFESLGIPNRTDFGYYALASEEQGSGNILVHSQQKIVSMVTFFEPGSLDVASIPTVSSVEPLIAKNEIDIYYLFYKRDNCYMVEVALPDDPTSSYLAWPVLYGITIMDTEYSGLLTGDIDLEIVSIPGESGSEKVVSPNTDTTSLPEWVDKIPYVPGNSNHIGISDTDSSMEDYYDVNYSDIVNSDYYGMPYSDNIKYLEYRFLGFLNYALLLDGKVVFIAKGFPNEGFISYKSHSYSKHLSSTEPLVAKSKIADRLVYLFFKRDNGYEVVLQQGSRSGRTLGIVAVTSEEFCTFLNGEQELEIVSIPEENDTHPNTPTIVDTPNPSQPDWVSQIPLVPGYSDLYYFENEGVQAHKRPHDFAPGGIENFMGLSSSEQVSYSTADIDGGTVCFGQGPDRTVSYAEIYDKPLESISTYYYMASETEPVIGKRDDGYCFLFYKRDYDDGGIDSYSYEIYMVQQTDSPNYKDWLFRAYIYVNAPEFYDYLNGEKELEIISVPGHSAQ